MHKIETNLDVEHLGVLDSCLGDAANQGLAYLLRTMDGKQLMPLTFCKDYFQDFTYVNFMKDTSKGQIYGYTAPLIPDVFTENDSFNLLLIPHSKTTIKEEYFNKEKVKLAQECILNTNTIKLYKNQLEVFERQLIKIGFLNRFTTVDVIDVSYNTPKIEGITQKAISLKMDSAYFLKPELLSLYLFFVRNFLTCYIFVSEFEDLYTFLRDLRKYQLKFIYAGDQSMFYNASVQLQLPMFLEGKLKTTTWDLFKEQPINTIHNKTGIVSYLTSNKLLND